MRIIIIILSLLLMMGTAVAQNGVLKNCAATRNSTDETGCLACAIFYEAGTEPLVGKFAVGFSTINRVRHPEYPKSVCSVVWQRLVHANGMSVPMYSWTVHPRLMVTTNVTNGTGPVLQRQWGDSLRVAEYLVKLQHSPNYSNADITRGSTMFHAASLGNGYFRAPRRTHVGRFGSHHFYAPSNAMTSANVSYCDTVRLAGFAGC